MLRIFIVLIAGCLLSFNSFAKTDVSVKKAKPVNISSECKGSEESVCGQRVDCRWINGFTRSDGIEVRSYCRKGNKKSATKAKPSVKKSGS